MAGYTPQTQDRKAVGMFLDIGNILAVLVFTGARVSVAGEDKLCYSENKWGCFGTLKITKKVREYGIPNRKYGAGWLEDRAADRQRRERSRL